MVSLPVRRTQATVVLLLVVVALGLQGSGIAPAIVPAMVPAANKQGSTGLKFVIGTGTFTAGNTVTTDASGNLIDSGSAGGAAWSGLTNPAGNLSLTMAANLSTFTYNAATGSYGMKWTDTLNNVGTGALGLFSTAAGSSAPPWQADANGVGFRVGTTGSIQSVGQTASGLIALSGSTSGSCGITTPATSGAITGSSARECSIGAKATPFSGGFYSYLEGGAGQPAVNAASCTGATIGTGATNLAGTITGLPGGACSVVVTFANSATATTGWACAVSDQTTGNLFRQTASSATTVTFAGTSLASDVLVYGPCAAY